MTPMGLIKTIGNTLDALNPMSKNNFLRPGLRNLGGLTERPGEEEQRQGLTNQSTQSSNFAEVGEGGFGRLGGELQSEADALRDIARGQNSVSAEQLRQALGQNMAQQRSMAASSSPQNATMAALMASRNSMNLGSGLAGQQALAGMQERQMAQQALMQALLQQRAQDLQAALGGRQNAIGALGGITPGQSTLDKWAGPIMGGLQMFAGGKK